MHKYERLEKLYYKKKYVKIFFIFFFIINYFVNFYIFSKKKQKTGKIANI